MNIESGIFFINDEDKTEEVVDCLQIEEGKIEVKLNNGESSIYDNSLVKWSTKFEPIELRNVVIYENGVQMTNISKMIFFDEFDKLFEEIDNNFDEYLGDYSQELYDKNKKIIKFIRVKLSSADYDLIPESSLQSIKNNIKEILVKFKDIINVKKINIIDNDLMLNNEVYFDVILKETPYINSFDLEKSEQTNLIRDSINSIKNLTKSSQVHISV